MKWYRAIKYIVVNFKKIENIVNQFSTVEGDAYTAKKIAENARDIIVDRTTIGVDVSPIGRDPHVVFVCGRYKNQDYVQLYSLQSENFSRLVQHLKEEQRHGTVSRVDSPPSFRRGVHFDL